MTSAAPDVLAYSDALEAYVRAALEFILAKPARTLHTPHFTESLIDDEREVVEYVTNEGEPRTWRRRRPVFEAGLHRLPEYRRVVAAVDSLPELVNMIGKDVVSAGQTRHVDISHFTDDALLDMVMVTGGLTFSSEAFAERWDRLWELVAKGAVQHFMFAPLLRFTTDSMPVALDDEVEIAEMGPRERWLCDLFGYVQFRNPPRLCIRVRRQIPPPQGSRDDEIAFITEARSAIESIVALLRLLHEGVFCVPGAIHDHGLQGTFGPGAAPFPGDRRAGAMLDYHLGDAEAEKLLTLWREHRGVLASDPIARPLQRLSICGESQRPEERIVNLAVCAESLLLSKEPNSELSHRMALRAAFLLESESRGRDEIYRWFKKAYGLRGKVVHTAIVPQEIAAFDPEGTGFLARFANDLRSLILMALGLAESGRSLVQEADDRIYGRMQR